jgi:uncharacterized membrane protein YcaP (DUF421 family)
VTANGRESGGFGLPGAGQSATSAAMQDAPLFFSGWDSVGRTVLLGLLSYVALVVFLRISGKRTLSKMNMFDFVVTIAFGSILASMLVSRNVTLAQGIAGFATLILAQLVVTFISVRSDAFRNLVKGTAAILYYDGQWYRGRMLKERITEGEMRAAARGAGLGGMGEVGAIILETNGDLSVVQKSQMQGEPTLPDRERAPDVQRS